MNFNEEEMYKQFLKVKSAFKTGRIAAYKTWTSLTLQRFSFVSKSAQKLSLKVKILSNSPTSSQK